MPTWRGEETRKKYRWNCAIKDENGVSKFWSVEAYDEAAVKAQIAEKRWEVLQINRVKEADEGKADESRAGKGLGIAAAVGIAAIILSAFIPSVAAAFVVLAGVTAAIVEVMLGRAALGFFVLALAFIRIYFLWAQFSQIAAKL